MKVWISSTTVYTRDLDAAKDFYVNKLGFELRTDDTTTVPGYRWLAVGPVDGETGIVFSLSEDPNLMGKFSGMVINAEDVNALYQDWSAKGVNFTQPPTEQPYGVEAQFADHEGNSYVLVQR